MNTNGDEETPGTPPAGEAGPAHAAPEASATTADEGADSSGASPPASPIDELRRKVSDAASGFLKQRLGLEQDEAGNLHLPERGGVFENVGQRADQFLRGFLKGVVEKTPEEREAEAGLRDKDDVPSATEVVGRLLSKASDAVSTSFHRYLKQHVNPDPKAQVVVDGQFLFQHGAPLLATFVQALGSQFAEREADPTGPGEDAPADPKAPDAQSAAPASEGAEPGAERVDYRVDLPSLFTSLFVRPRDDERKDGGGEP